METIDLFNLSTIKSTLEIFLPLEELEGRVLDMHGKTKTFWDFF